MNYDKLLAGKTAWITGDPGQNRGAYASLFAEHGARLVLIGEGGDYECDLSDPEAAGVLCAELATAGAPDVWLHIADIYGRAYVDELNYADFERMLRVSVVTPHEIMGRVAGGMAARGGGAVVFVSGHYGVQGMNRVSGYGAAKGGEISLAVSLAAAYAKDGIRVNAIVPGASYAAVGDDLLACSGVEDTPEFWHTVQPVNRRVRPDEIANAALFLASDMAAYITGETLLVNGAEHLIAHNHNFPRKDRVMP